MAPDEIVPTPAPPPLIPEPLEPLEPTVESPGSGLRMSIIEHLRELRVRLIRATIALTAGFVLAYFFSDQLFAALTLPIREVSNGKLLLIGTGVGEAFFTKIKVSLVAGLFIASPAVFLRDLEIYRARTLSERAQDGVPVHPLRDHLFRLRRIFLLGGSIQSRIRIFPRSSIPASG